MPCLVTGPGGSVPCLATLRGNKILAQLEQMYLILVIYTMQVREFCKSCNCYVTKPSKCLMNVLDGPSPRIPFLRTAPM